MDLQATFVLLAAGVGATLAGVGGERLRRRAPLAWHAHLPWNGITFAGMTAALVAAVHLFTLAR